MTIAAKKIFCIFVEVYYSLTSSLADPRVREPGVLLSGGMIFSSLKDVIVFNKKWANRFTISGNLQKKTFCLESPDSRKG